VEPEEAEAEAGEADGAGGGGDAVDADDAGFDHVASTRIQAVARGRRARREVAAMRAARAEAAVDAAMAAAEAASAAASTTAAAVPNKSFFPDKLEAADAFTFDDLVTTTAFERREGDEVVDDVEEAGDDRVEEDT
jgi:hypothetical protein